MDNEELNRLLRQWKAPDKPPHLRAPRARSSWQNFVARLVDYRQDSRAGTGARRARAGGGRNRVDLGDLPTAGTGTGARDVRPLAIWRAEDIRRAGAIQAHGSARGTRRGARRAELPARASRPRSIGIRASSSATWSTGRCEPPSTTRRTGIVAAGGTFLRTSRCHAHGIRLCEQGSAGARRGVHGRTPPAVRRQSPDEVQMKSV